MVKFNLGIAQKVLPYFIYKRVQFQSYREIFTFKIDYGFGYWLRSVRVKYPLIGEIHSSIIPSTYLPAGIQGGKIKLEFFDNANFKARQPIPFTAELISSPGSDQCIAFAAPSPVDQDGYGANFSASPAVASVSNLNFLYRYGDIIRIDITGQDPTGGFPGLLDLLLVGYYVPQETFEMYGGKE